MNKWVYYTLRQHNLNSSLLLPLSISHPLSLALYRHRPHAGFFNGWRRWAAQKKTKDCRIACSYRNHRWQFHKWKSQLIPMNLSCFVGCESARSHNTPDWHHKLHCFMVVQQILSSFRIVCDQKNCFSFFILIDFRQTLLVFKLVYSLPFAVAAVAVVFVAFMFTFVFFCLLWGTRGSILHFIFNIRRPKMAKMDK